MFMIFFFYSAFLRNVSQQSFNEDSYSVDLYLQTHLFELQVKRNTRSTSGPVIKIFVSVF